MTKFTIKGEYIELCDLLKVCGCCSSGGEAKAAIADGLVAVDSVIDTRKRAKIRPGQVVAYSETRIQVVAGGTAE